MGLQETNNYERLMASNLAPSGANYTPWRQRGTAALPLVNAEANKSSGGDAAFFGAQCIE